MGRTALGLYKPWKWSRQDWAVDVLDKVVLAEATGLVFDRLGGAADGSASPGSPS